MSMLFFLLRCFSYLPYRWQMALGSRLGRLAGRLLAKRRLVVEININRCFPELSVHQRAALVQANFANLGQVLFESALAFYASDRKIRSLFQVEGLDVLQAALQKKKGVILVAAHMVCPDLVARFLTMLPDCRFALMYRKQNNEKVERQLLRARRRYADSLIQKHEMRRVVQELKRNAILGYMVDQNAGSQHVFAPFFGHQAATVSVLDFFVKHSGAQPILFDFYRREDGRGYVVRFVKSLDDLPTGSKKQDATRINSELEALIRQHPAQYWWIHRRFKTRPDGEQPFY